MNKEEDEKQDEESLFEKSNITLKKIKLNN